MHQKIRITYLTYDDEGSDQYTSTRTIGLDEPLRAVALSVINESLGKTKHNWVEETHDDQPIVLYLDQSNKNPLQGFGIKYGINSDDSLQFLNEYAPLRHEWTLAEIYELRDNGYIKGSNDLIIATPGGLGAGGFELAQILEVINYIGGIYGGFESIAKVVGYIKNRALIIKWKKMDLRELEQIRALLDEKSVWTTNELKKRLSVNEQFATKILFKLGYELSSNSWRLGQSQQSLANRSKWLAKEQEIEKKRQHI